MFHLIVNRIDWNRVISRAQRRQRHEEVSSDEEDDIDAPRQGAGVASFRDDDCRLTQIYPARVDFRFDPEIPMSSKAQSCQISVIRSL